jgi:lactoylglutathione lyase
MNLRRLLFLVAVVMAPAARAGEIQRPRVLGIAHVAFYVDDMEKAVAFYHYLGYEVPYVLPRPGGGNLVWIKINERQSVELFPGSEAPKGSDRLSHIAFETDDADAMRLYLRSKGFDVPPQTPIGKSGNKNFTIADPDGNRVEFVEYLPNGWTAREKGRHVSDRRISTRMRHTGVKVVHLDAALGFYRDILGLTEFYRQSQDGKTLSWVNLQVPDGDDYLEFMLHVPPPTTERLRSMHHICLEVEDIKAAHRLLASRTMPAGLKTPTEMRIGRNGKWQINLFDPDGSRVELMEPNTHDGLPVPPSGAPPPNGPAPKAR